MLGWAVAHEQLGQGLEDLEDLEDLVRAEPSLDADRQASRLNSSTTTSIRSTRPSWVRSWTKSYARTWFGRSGLSRTHEPSFSHKRPRFGCFLGTLSPSRRQIRSTRFAFTRQPAARSKAVTRR